MTRPFIYGISAVCDYGGRYIRHMDYTPLPLVTPTRPVIKHTAHMSSIVCSGDVEPVRVPPESGFRSRAEKSNWMAALGKRGHRAGHKGATLRAHREGK